MYDSKKVKDIGLRVNHVGLRSQDVGLRVKGANDLAEISHAT